MKETSGAGIWGDSKTRKSPRPSSPVFRGVNNRMESGYLLRDVINLVDKIRFDSSDEFRTLSHAVRFHAARICAILAGRSCEFYTPRPVVQLMVAVTDPRLGDVVLDPACGTGGFLVEAYTHMLAQCRTGSDRQTLETQHLRRRGQAPALSVGRDEPAAARHGIAQHHLRQQPGQPLTSIGRTPCLVDARRRRQSRYLCVVNLDIKNPNSVDPFEHMPPEQLVEDIIGKERRVMALMDEIGTLLAEPVSHEHGWRQARIGDVDYEYR